MKRDEEWREQSRLIWVRGQTWKDEKNQRAHSGLFAETVEKAKGSSDTDRRCNGRQWFDPAWARAPLGKPWPCRRWSKQMGLFPDDMTQCWENTRWGGTDGHEGLAQTQNRKKQGRVWEQIETSLWSYLERLILCHDLPMLTVVTYSIWSLKIKKGIFWIIVTYLCFYTNRNVASAKTKDHLLMWFQKTNTKQAKHEWSLVTGHCTRALNKNC